MPIVNRKVDKVKLLELIESQRNLMISVATGGSRIETVAHEYSQGHLETKRALAKLGLPDPNPYMSLWDWHGKWSSGDLPTYRSRREYIRELFAPLIERLNQDVEISAAVPLRAPTGWTRVDRALDRVREVLAEAKHEEDFQTVGLICREALISLAQVVYDPAIHTPPDGIGPSDTDAKRMLEGYIEKELSGGANEAARRYAKAALGLANDLQHSRTADFRDAAICAEATTSVVNFVALVSGRHSTEETGQ